jgi:5-methylcytosine-specific restriction endonuclease McrA
MPYRRCQDCQVFYSKDTAPGWRCPPCQGIYDAKRKKRNWRPSSSRRGYDGEYQRNKPLVIAQARNGWPCVICGKPFQPGQKITVEHIVPLRKGGTNVLANLGPAHAACNIGWNRK